MKYLHLLFGLTTFIPGVYNIFKRGGGRTDSARYCYSVWLKPKAFTSHQIDFKCHRTADEWNGHWTYSDFRWKLIRGGRPYLLNREPHSTHIYLLKKTGFSIVSDNKIKSDSKFKQNDLAPRFKNISDEDLTTSGVYILACKE